MAYTFAPRPITKIVETGMMRYTSNTIANVHAVRGQFVIVTGTSGVGKTTTAERISQSINDAFAKNPTNPDAYRARYYIATDHRTMKGKESPQLVQRRLLAEFAGQVLQLAVPADIRNINISKWMDAIVLGLRQQQVQIVFIDEAGYLPSNALDCLATLANKSTSRAFDHPLTIVLVGMHNLPANIQAQDNLCRRVADWVTFEPCNADEVKLVLTPLDPFFAALDLKSDDGRDVIEFLRSPEVSRGGLLGLIVPLAERAVAHARMRKVSMSLLQLRAAHTTKLSGQTQSAAAMQRGWK